MNLTDAIDILTRNGYKYTGKRVDMLEFLEGNDRYLTAKEVLEGLKSTHPNLSFDTIYRNLSLFTELDILETTELSGEKHYRFSCSKNEHHHHFICLDCGKTKEIANCPMDSVLNELNGFSVSGHKFEVYGHCNDCTH